MSINFEISKEEITEAIKLLKDGKVSGQDSIPAEVIKADTHTQLTTHYLARVWGEAEEIPADWREEYLVKLPKTEDMLQCENYRGIM